ncbi:MAG: hypothetical protein ACUVR8_09740 [Acidobacteriota bacterium]
MKGDVMKETGSSTASTPTTQVSDTLLGGFRTLSLPEKALTIAQVQAMLFSNSVVQVLSTVLRGGRPGAGQG